jgi:cation diffusion facilitator family transporter
MNVNPVDQEQRALPLSVLGALMMAVAGFGFAFLTHSVAILLDGAFSLIGFATGLLSMRIARLVRQPDDEKFQFGYSSFEPLLNLIKGIIIALVGLYAAFDAVRAILNGGRPIVMGYALVYAVIVASAGFAVSAMLRSTSRRIYSPLVEVDAKNWFMDGLLTVAVFIAFLIAYALRETSYNWMMDYADPAVVLLLVILSASLPYSIIRTSFKELLLAAPPLDIQEEAKRILDPELAAIAKEDYMVRMVKVGRFLHINIYILLAKEHSLNDVRHQDEIRERIRSLLTEKYQDITVDILFTCDARFAGVQSGP